MGSGVITCDLRRRVHKHQSTVVSSGVKPSDKPSDGSGRYEWSTAVFYDE
jgi:hypothetical protein